MAFSLKQLLVVTLIAAAGLAALTNADLPLVAELFNLFTLATIVLAGYSIWITVGEKRAFRCGFVGWAGVYFLATKWWSVMLIFGTHKILALGYDALLPSRIANMQQGPGSPYDQAYTDWLNRYDAIGQSLFTLLFGIIGGWVTVYFYRKRQQMLRQREQQTK